MLPKLDFPISYKSPRPDNGCHIVSRRSDTWIAKQKEPVTRPEAVRRLVALGLNAKKNKGDIDRREFSTSPTAGDRAERGSGRSVLLIDSTFPLI